MISLTVLTYNMSAGWGSVFLKPFNKMDKMTVAGVKSVTLRFLDNLITRPTCRSRCTIFPSSLSNSLNMHLFPH